jgi:DNA-directed RNA polymerase specialized sigma24 family protein
MIEGEEMLLRLGEVARDEVAREVQLMGRPAFDASEIADLKRALAAALKADSDKRLVDSAIAGDRRASDELVERLIPVLARRVRHVLRRRGRSGEEHGLEKDLVQDTLIRLFSNGGRVLGQWHPDKGAGLETWSGFIVDSVVLSFLRSGRRGAWRELPVETDREDVPDESTPELEARTLDRAFLGKLLHRLTDVLPPAKLSLFYALYVEERDADEVAAELGMSMNALYTARSRLIRLVQSEALRLAEEGAA